MKKLNWLSPRFAFAIIAICILIPCRPATTLAQDVGQGEIPVLDQLISQGKQLEKEGRWGEALSHYQQALKTAPDNSQIKTRRSIARIHFDLKRRYSDASYIKTLSSFDSSRALNLYAEVLLKIQSYYVDQPNWDNILRHGLASMEIALSDSVFLNANIPNVGRERIQQAVNEMNSILNKYSIKSRQDAYVLTSNVCRMMNRKLGLPIETSAHEFVCGAIIALDPYSAFMTSSQYGETMSQIEGNFVGLGVELKTSPTELKIVNVIPNGPAGRAGVADGDSIIAVQGKSVEDHGSEKAADALRGAEGSLIAITVKKTNGQIQKMQLRRQRVEIPSVEEASIIEPANGIAYVRLTNFQKTTSRDFDAALVKLHKQGMRILIVDLRGNPGGLLNTSVDIANRFIYSGVITSTRGRNPLEDYVHQAEMSGTWRIPLVVLIDSDSASASEIFAAAIRDHRRGIVVGQQSYGKGSVQGIFPLNVGGGGVRLTTAKFYSPKGVAISQRGVIPDVPVQIAAKPASNRSVNKSHDAILSAGIKVARRRLGEKSGVDN